MLRASVWLLGVALLGLAAPARAQAVRAERSTNYWVAHGSVTGGFVLAGFGARLLLRDPVNDTLFFAPDRAVPGHFSTTAVVLSDLLLVGETVAPVVVLGVGTGRAKLANATLIYAEALSITFGLNSLSKYWVRRPRPYTRHVHPAVRALHNCPDVEDDCLSFYSGHSSTAFTAAFAGGYLVNETLEMSASGHALTWGFLTAGAAATAHLRVRAGKHYYSDVLVGALAGTTIGIVVPILHGGRYTPSAGEVGAGAGGLVVGAALPLLVPTDEIPGGAVLLPALIDGHGVGLEASGTW